MTPPPTRWAGPIDWMARNSIAANLLMVILLGGGVWMALEVQKEVYPSFQLDIVEVDVSYPGASPAEVEQGILLPIEEAVRGVRGIKEITSTAREGSASIAIELVSGTPRMSSFQDIDQAVKAIRTFPDDIEQPQVRLQTEERDVMRIVLFGDVDIWMLRKLAEQVRDRLASHEAITQVEIRRVPGYMTHVEIPRQTLRAYGLTLGQVARTIEVSSQDVPAGTVEARDGEILLRLKERKQWADEFASIVIATADSGATVTLGEVARITDGFEEAGFHSQFNRQPSVDVSIYRVGNQSPLQIADAVERMIEDLRTELPPGVNVRVDSNRAEDYRDRLALLLENGALAVVIVFGILALFLEYRLAFWVMAGMTTSFVGSMLLLPVFDLSLNMVTMFAFLVALGIVVDDAIVVGENVYEYRQRGKGPLDAAIAGTRDISGPVVFSILTNIVAFIPLMFVPGVTGKFWAPLPAVVILVLAISLLEALFILPAHLGHSRRPSAGGAGRLLHRRQQAFVAWFSRMVDRYYRPLLDVCLRNRYVTLTAAVAILVVVGGYGYSGHMGMVMMPEVAADEIEAGIRLPVGTTRDQAARVAADVTESTHRMFEKHQLHRVAEGIKTNVRRGNFIDVEIVMRPPDEHDMTAGELIELWRREIGDIDGVDQISFEAERGPGGWRDDIEVDLSHDDVEILEAASLVFKERARTFTSTRDVNDNLNRGKVQFDVDLRPEGRLLGLTAVSVGQQLRDAFFGALAVRHLRGTNEVEVRVKLPEEERKSLFHLEDFVVMAPDGTEVPLRDAATVTVSEAFSSIERRDGRRVVTVGMDVEPERETGRVRDAIVTEILPELRGRWPGLTWSFQGTDAEMRESTQTLWGGFLLAMAVIYALLAIAFRSYLQPLIVMIAIPFGIVGAVIGHILLGYDLSLISLMGVIALSGVVVNDSLIMVDHANRHREGGTPFQAIHQAGIRRFRPILLTTLTTFAGLTPIIMETSRQAYYLVPMAISLGFGIVFATSIILLIVPCLYLILEDIARLLGGVAATAPVPAAVGRDEEIGG